MLKILILEDSIEDADLMQRLLVKEKMNCEFRLAMDKNTFIHSLEEFLPDVILSDNSMPQFNSSDALKVARQRTSHIPFILVSGTIPEEYAASIIKQGADDFILKDRMARLPAAIAAAVKHRCTEREKQETTEQLKINEKNYRELVERISDGFIALDSNWYFTYVNKKAGELFNTSSASLVGKNMWAQFPPIMEEAIYHAYLQALQTQKNIYLKEYSAALNKWLETTIYPSKTGISVYFRDITEQHQSELNLKLLEVAMQEQKMEEHRKIARAIIKSQEKERNHIGQELHDNINQILAGSKMYLSLAGKKNEAVKELISYPMGLIDTSIKEIRLLSSKLVTPQKNINLEELLKDLLINFNHTSIKGIQFEYVVSNKILSDDLKLNIYRVIQELSNNILKYANAQNISISIKEQDHLIKIIITDDGRGFDLSSKRNGIGISNMINRVESFNGCIKMESSEGNGCSTAISIPY
jgi:two-component system sensor histidine kinase UhpB